MEGRDNGSGHYPPSWENVAHLRVFRTSTGDWDKVVSWRADMVKRGWKLLRVSSDAEEIVAVFGKTRIGEGQLPRATAHDPNKG
jgi:hypothetical protein